MLFVCSVRNLNKQMKTKIYESRCRPNRISFRSKIKQRAQTLIDPKMLFRMLSFLLIFSKIETFFLAMNTNHLFIECARSIIIKNHYWFLSEFFHLLQSYDRNNFTNEQQIPFDHLYFIFNHISIHCQQAYQFSQKNKKNLNLDQFYQWFKTQMKN